VSSPALRRLLLLRDACGPETGARKRALLREVWPQRLATIRQVIAFHEVLSYWRAYPDDDRLLRAVISALKRFGSRPDVHRLRDALLNSGIAGTDIVYPFGRCTATWLAERWPAHLAIEWDAVPDADRLTRSVIVHALPAEVPGLDAAPTGIQPWMQHLRSPRGSDASWLIDRAAAAAGGPWTRDRLFDELDLPVRVKAGRTTPSRTLAHVEAEHVAFRGESIQRGRPDLAAEIGRPPQAVRHLAPAEAGRIVDLAREAMVTRQRDLDAFAWADVRDVRIADCGDGLQIALVGVLPGRRFVLESMYGFLTLKNGVPIGYGVVAALFNSAEIAFNVFETFRGGEAAHILGRLLATAHAVFGSDTFSIDPYQLGADNEEGLASGAWWFYYKLGFRPRAAAILPVVAREMARIRRKPSYRTPRATLEQLVRHNLYFSRGARRRDVLGVLTFDRIGLAVSRCVGRRFGDDRARAARVLADQAAVALGAGRWRDWPRDERTAWAQWAPVVAVLPGLGRWSRSDRRALVDVVRAKGRACEAEFVSRFDRHQKLRAAIVRLSGAASRDSRGVITA